jgi:hypothetical protein
MFTLYHAIEENPSISPDAGLSGQAVALVYWDENNNDKNDLISLSGYEEQPFWAPRWDTTGNDTWGQGPGHDALPDLRELQLQTKRKGEATDSHSPGKGGRVQGQAERVSPLGGFRRRSRRCVSKLVDVPYQVPYQAIAAVARTLPSSSSRSTTRPTPTCSWRSPT